MALHLGAVANKRKTKNKIVVKKKSKIVNEDVITKFNTIETTNLLHFTSSIMERCRSTYQHP
jgi:hypothetical protein